MRSKQNTAAVVLLVLLAATVFGVFRTNREGPPRGGRKRPADSSATVDQSSLTTAEQLVQLPTTRGERSYAQDALRLADQEMDLSFADAVREAAEKPRTMTAEARAIAARLQQAENELAASEAEVAQLTAAAAKATGSSAVSLNDRLNLAKAHVALHDDEADDARQDLIRAGGDPQGRMQAMVQEHEASSQHSDSTRIALVASIDGLGLVRHMRAWWDIDQKRGSVTLAKLDADSAAARFATQHNLVEGQAAPPDSVRAPNTSSQPLNHDSAAALVRTTERRASESRSRSSLDQHVENQQKLSTIYGGWLGVLSRQQRAVINRSLRDVAYILLIALIGVFVDKWIEHLLGTMSMDRRRLQTACMITRVLLQVLGALIVLLVIFGPPNNLGTFLGLAGAGLTVALKDFIIGFAGWFVLMGKDGIRMGDMVEINGVTGEVVELGMFHTVLLETGEWSDAGHPTGRRVTFTNSFAIEGHYFNFSTSGQWLWDDVRVVVPGGRDPYPIADAIQKQVEEATADSARAAEQQWKGARRAPNLSALTAAPSVNIKPIVGGTEITVHYITHVSERSNIRAGLYRTAVDLLGGKDTTRPAAPA